MTEEAYFKPERGQRPGANQDQRLDWWREVKFGMFIHWGVYSIPAGVWHSEPHPGHRRMDHAARRDTGRGIRRASATIQSRAIRCRSDCQTGEGGRAKIHRFHIETSRWLLHVSDCADRLQHCRWYALRSRYLKGAGPNACAREGIKLGLYYSQTQDWHHPDGFGNTWNYDESQQDFGAYIDNYVKPQVREILSNYGPIAIVWFDTPKIISQQQSRELLELVRELQPDCLVCGRLGNAMGDYATSQDNAVPPDLQAETDWETPATINDTWGFKTHDHNWKSSTQLIRNLVDIVSKGGNYLLNIGPDSLGAIPQPSIERLQAMGEWIDIHGDSIYGTVPGPIQGVDWCRTTQKGDTVYLHIFEWADDGRFVLPGTDLSSAAWLDVSLDAALSLSRVGDALVLQGPSQMPNGHTTVICLGK